MTVEDGEPPAAMVAAVRSSSDWLADLRDNEIAVICRAVLTASPPVDHGRVEKLEAALEPFAAAAARLNPALPDDEPITLTIKGGTIYVYALSRFRKAHAALANKATAK